MLAFYAAANNKYIQICARHAYYINISKGVTSQSHYMYICWISCQDVEGMVRSWQLGEKADVRKTTIQSGGKNFVTWTDRYLQWDVGHFHAAFVATKQ